MRYFSVAACMTAFALGCGRPQEPIAPPAAPPIVLNAPAEFTVTQRSTVALPGSNGKIVITLDDITRGQVLATLAWKDGKPVMAAQSFRPNDTHTFSVGGRDYQIKLKNLKNVLIGDDEATLVLWPATQEADHKFTEDEKIEKLILSLERLQGAKFIRNGKEHTKEEAILHLRSKWDWKKSEIKTVEDFIRIVGTKSSVSDEPYLIRLPDGTEMKTEEWFRNQ